MREYEELGISINCSKKGFNILLNMIADGCPRYYTKECTYKSKPCVNTEKIFRDGCYKCWKNYLEKRINVKG